MGVSSTPTRTAEFREALAAGSLAADGAMGTMLLSKRALGNRSLDELNLSLPALVRDVHQEYLRAGAQILRTNTFGANRTRLSAFGFEDRVRAINQAGVRIAREAARGFDEDRPAFVAGVVGPLGGYVEPLGATTLAEARAVFREQMDALIGSGVDLLVLETFRDLRELHEAIQAAREAGGASMPVAAHVSVEDDGALACGASTREFTKCLQEWPVDVIGVNCSSGPHACLETIEAMLEWTNKPLSAIPNAGLPSLVDGRYRYPCSPEYLAQYARRFLRAGVRIVGGCCGTTPEHIRQIRLAVSDAVSEPQQEGGPRRAVVMVEETEFEKPLEETPLASRSELGAKLASGHFVVIAEMLAPSGPDASKEIEAANFGKQAGIDCIAIGSEPGTGTRMSAPAACELIQRQAGVECVLRLPRRDRNILALQGELLGAHALGIRNLLFVAGDSYSVGPVAAASNLNLGLNLGGHRIDSQASMLIGVAVNPASTNLEDEIERFESMAKAGADFAITQPVFDTESFEAFLRRIEPYKVPVIAGILPLTSFRNAEFLINEKRMPVPPAYMARMSVAQTREASRAEGIAIALELAEGLRGMAAGIHIGAPQGGAQLAVEVAKEIASRR